MNNKIKLWIPVVLGIILTFSFIASTAVINPSRNEPISNLRSSYMYAWADTEDNDNRTDAEINIDDMEFDEEYGTPQNPMAVQDDEDWYVLPGQDEIRFAPEGQIVYINVTLYTIFSWDIDDFEIYYMDSGPIPLASGVEIEDGELTFIAPMIQGSANGYILVNGTGSNTVYWFIVDFILPFGTDDYLEENDDVSTPAVLTVNSSTTEKDTYEQEDLRLFDRDFFQVHVDHNEVLELIVDADQVLNDITSGFFNTTMDDWDRFQSSMVTTGTTYTWYYVGYHVSQDIIFQIVNGTSMESVGATYDLTVNVYNENYHPDYLGGIPDDVYEDNDVKPNAAELIPGSNYQKRIKDLYMWDDDWYKIELSTSGIFVIEDVSEMVGEQSHIDHDIHLWVDFDNGTVLNTSQSNLIYVYIETPKTVYVKVNYTGAPSAEYWLDLAFSPDLDEPKIPGFPLFAIGIVSIGVIVVISRKYLTN